MQFLDVLCNVLLMGMKYHVLLHLGYWLADSRTKINFLKLIVRKQRLDLLNTVTNLVSMFMNRMINDNYRFS